MLFRLTAIAVALLAPVAQAATSDYYDYDHPELWQDMPDSACAGLKNSPIALNTMDCTHFANYMLPYPTGDTCGLDEMDFKITKNGVWMGYKAGVTCAQPGFEIPKDSIEETFTHLQTHIHLSSEHTIDGNYFGAELHMVHAKLDADGNIQRAAVLGTMVKPSSPVDNPTFERYLRQWQTVATEKSCDSCGGDMSYPMDFQTVDVYENMRGQDFYHYDGGLTTPPCSEVVWWNFNTEPWLISIRQFQIMTDIILNTKVEKDGECKEITVASQGGSTSRPPQPLNGRVVDKICALS